MASMRFGSELKQYTLIFLGMILPLLIAAPLAYRKNLSVRLKFGALKGL